MDTLFEEPAQASEQELAAGLDHVRASPADGGPVELLVRRPQAGRRELVEVAEVDGVVGLVGDNWLARGSRLTADGTAHPGMQLTLMNTRAVQLVAGGRDRWALAGDQVYVDLDLGEANLPAGSRIALGTAEVEVSGEPHRGCQKFTERFGLSATRWVNSPDGIALRLRGVNARVVVPGIVRVGDLARPIRAGRPTA